MSGFVKRSRGPLLAGLTIVFLTFTLWAAHTPGEPRTLRDFIFVIELFGIPFLVFAYALWSLMGSAEIATRQDGDNAPRARIALTGAILGAASAALLLLIFPFWDVLVEREHLAELWIISGLLTTTAAILCGIIGSSQLRRSAILSIVLLPFWIFAAAFLAKAIMD